MGIVPEDREKVKVGQRFERLVVLGRSFTTERKKCRRITVCRCDCGKIVAVSEANLLNCHSRSCGCLHREKFTKHGSYQNGKRVRLYRIWQTMHNRCRNKSQVAFDRYGGRGISVCSEWGEYTVFRDWALENGYRNDLTIDRIDNDGSYCPQNCRWVTMREQSQNTIRNRLMTAFGETKCLSEWHRDPRNGMSKRGLCERLKKGMSLQAAMTTPSRITQKSRVG